MQSQTSQIKSWVVCSCDLWQTGVKQKQKEWNFCINFHSDKCLIQTIWYASVANAKQVSLPDGTAFNLTMLQCDSIVKRVG